MMEENEVDKEEMAQMMLEQAESKDANNMQLLQELSAEKEQVAFEMEQTRADLEAQLTEV